MIVRADKGEEQERESPGKRFAFRRKSVFTTDDTGAPFDMDRVTLPPGKRNFPHHSHAALWEAYYFVSGDAVVRIDGETHTVSAGDTVVCPPGTAHQISNESDADVVYLVISDDPPFDCCYYPDSGKMLVSPKRVWQGYPSDDRYFWTTTEEEYYTGEE